MGTGGWRRAGRENRKGIEKADRADGGSTRQTRRPATAWGGCPWMSYTLLI